jgi:small subunit ribosomal protein S17
MDKTIVVAVERRVSHPRYDRVVKRTSKFYAHDEKNACKEGDVVTIVESRPLSRLKRWRLREIVRSGTRLAGPIRTDATAESQDAVRPAHRKHQERSGAAAPGEAAAGTAGSEGTRESKDEE